MDGADAVKAVAGLLWIVRIVGSFGVLLIGVAALYWTPLTANHALILDYLRVAASWPIIVFVLGCIVLVKFTNPITALIHRIVSIRLPGGSEVMTQQPPEAITTKDGPQAADPAPASANELARLWEYRYLNYFLVPKTQGVLDWLCERPGLTVETYDASLLPFVPNPVERSVMINVLTAHHLVAVDNNQTISVTEKGREYRTFRGPITPSAPVTPGAANG